MPSGAWGAWSDDKEADLLAWIDYLLQHPNINFDKTIVQHLGNRFRLTQIKVKARDCVAKYADHKYQGSKLRSILENGSSILQQFPLNDLVATKLGELENLEAGTSTSSPKSKKEPHLGPEKESPIQRAYASEHKDYANSIGYDGDSDQVQDSDHCVFNEVCSCLRKCFNYCC